MKAEALNIFNNHYHKKMQELLNLIKLLRHYSLLVFNHGKHFHPSLIFITLTAYFADCHYADCHYADCHYADCHYADCHYAQCLMLISWHHIS